MSIELVVALITLSGVIISIIFNAFINSRQIATELTKLRVEIHQEFSRKLFEKRFETYPKLYSYLSKFIKAIQFDGISRSSVKELFDNFQKWDTQNAYLFSGHTGQVSYNIRLLLAGLVKLSDKELRQKFTPEALSELRHKLQELEIALKNEMGVYAYQTPTTVSEVPSIVSYEDVANVFFEKAKK